MPYISPKGTLKKIASVLPATSKSRAPTTPPPPAGESNWWTKVVNCPYLRSTEEFKELTKNVWARSEKVGDLVKWAGSWTVNDKVEERIHLRRGPRPYEVLIFTCGVIIVLYLMGQAYRLLTARRETCIRLEMKSGRGEEKALNIEDFEDDTH